MGAARSKQKQKDRVIVVCSNSGEESVQGLISFIKNDMLSGEEPARVEFRPLPYNIKDMKKFKLSGIDALLLCHSIDIKGALRTDDGPNSIYDKFLHKAKNCVGKKKVAVIVHDYEYPLATLDSLSKTHSAESTFNMTSLVLALGKLAADSIDMTRGQRDEFTSFFRGALSYHRKIKGAFYRFFYRLIRQ